MKRKYLLFCAAALGAACVILYPRASDAQEMGDLPFYGLSSEEMNSDYFTWKLFLENQNREPCQHYLAPPPGFMFRGCDLERIPAQTASVEVFGIEPAAGEPAVPAPVLSSYTLYFDFDRDNIRASEEGELNAASQDIMKYKPTQITIEGHADTAGPSDYNVDLSQRRIDSVEQALASRGINDVIYDAMAYGESRPAVQTGDGVPMQENRRVIIGFEHQP